MSPDGPDREARAIMAVTRRLPKVYGVGAFANVLKRIYARKRRAPIVHDVHGARMHLDPNDELDRNLLFTPQLYDREMLAFLRANLKPGDAFLDAGAHIGHFTLVAAPLVAPGGRVLAVDANPTVFQVLRQNVEMNHLSNVTLVNVGLADAKDRLKLSRPPDGLRGVASFLGGDGDIEIDVRPLADVAAEHGFDRFAGVKMDIEGFEFRTLKRYLEDTPRERWPRFMIVECLPGAVEKAGGNVIDMLVSKGYQVRWKKWADHILTL